MRIVLVVLVALFAAFASALASGNAAEAAPSRGLRVSGDQLIDGAGQPVRLADLNIHLAQHAAPRLRALERANAAYAAHDVQTALRLYEQVAATVPSDAESPSVSSALNGLARFRALLARTTIGDEDGAEQEMNRLVEEDPGAPFTRLAAQFWDQYGMTASASAACAELAPDIDSQTEGVFGTLHSLGIGMQHDELCVLV